MLYKISAREVPNDAYHKYSTYCYSVITISDYCFHQSDENREGKKRPNTACTGQVRAFAHTFGIQPQTADSAPGGFVRQVPPLPVTPAVGLAGHKGFSE